MIVKYTKAAQTDVEDIFEYIATEANESIADRVVDRIVKICEFLGEYSELGRRRPEFDSFGLEVRSIVEGSYVIFYASSKGSIYIVRVVHSARDISQSYFLPLLDISN